MTWTALHCLMGASSAIIMSEIAMVGQLTVKTRTKSTALSREMVQAVKAARRDESA